MLSGFFRKRFRASSAFLMQGKPLAPPKLPPRLALNFSLKTRVLDCNGVLFVLRTFVGDRVEKLMPRVVQLLNEFADHMEKHGTGFSDADLRKDLRGPHAKSCDGYDRNNKSVSPFLLLPRTPFLLKQPQVPARTAFTTRNQEALDKLFDKSDAMYELE